MRGTDFSNSKLYMLSGIIPAHAGNSVLCTEEPECLMDHPRACGEQPFVSLVHSVNEGSSPRMRGTEVNDSLNLATDGIIPAHAGNSMHRMSE